MAMTTPRISRILVPTDGSEPARRAVDFSASVADSREVAEVFALYVAYVPRPLPAGPTTLYQMSLDSLLPEEKEEAQMIVDLAAARIRALVSNPEIVVTPMVVVHDSPARAILEFAEQNDIDIIVMGSRGLGEIAGIFLGSVSHRVIHGAKCPVLIVK